MTAFFSTLIQIGDILFGSSLFIPRDIAVLLIGAISGFILIGIRRLTVDGAYLNEIAADERQLRELLRQAKINQQPDQVARLRMIRGLVRQRKGRAELIFVSVSLIYLLMATSWGQARFEFLPLQPNHPFTFAIHTPAASRGEIAHVVPSASLTSESGWIRQIEMQTQSGSPSGEATWKLTATSSPPRQAITVRLGNQTYHHPITIDGIQYQSPELNHDGLIQTSVQLERYCPLGWIPSQIAPGLAGWTLLMLIPGMLVFFGFQLIATDGPSLETRET